MNIAYIIAHIGYISYTARYFTKCATSNTAYDRENHPFASDKMRDIKSYAAFPVLYMKPVLKLVMPDKIVSLTEETTTSWDFSGDFTTTPGNVLDYVL